MLRLCLQSRHCTVLHYTEAIGGTIVGQECGDWSLTRLACRTLHIPVMRFKVLVRGLFQAFWGAELHAERHGLLRGASIVNLYLRWELCTALHTEHLLVKSTLSRADVCLAQMHLLLGVQRLTAAAAAAAVLRGLVKMQASPNPQTPPLLTCSTLHSSAQHSGVKSGGQSE
jgi:hypothetical protein